MRGRDIVDHILGTGLTAILGVVSGALLARGLGPDLRGQFAGLVSWIGMLAAIGEGGLGHASLFYAGKAPDTAGRLLAQSGTAGLLIGVALWGIGTPILLSHLRSQAFRTQWCGSP